MCVYVCVHVYTCTDIKNETRSIWLKLSVIISFYVK